MKSLKRRLSLLSRRAFDLADLLASLTSLGAERGSPDIGQHESYIREVSFELLVAISQFDECRAVHQAYWPLEEQPYRALDELLFSDRASMLAGIFEYGRDEIVRRVVKWRMGVDDDTDLFSKILQWR